MVFHKAIGAFHTRLVQAEPLTTISDMVTISVKPIWLQLRCVVYAICTPRLHVHIGMTWHTDPTGT